MKICRTCIFWKGQDAASGECRRYPPTLVLLAITGSRSLWPTTVSLAGCGEHKSPPGRPKNGPG